MVGVLVMWRWRWWCGCDGFRDRLIDCGLWGTRGPCVPQVRVGTARDTGERDGDYLAGTRNSQI